MSTIQRETIRGGMPLSATNLETARASAEAMARGEDPFEAARAKYFELNRLAPGASKAKRRLTTPKQRKNAPTAPETHVNAIQDDGKSPSFDVRRYLLAICRLASGQFDNLTNAQLLDCACLSAVQVAPATEWAATVTAAGGK